MLRAGDPAGNSRKIQKFMTENQTPEALTAAGWCAPRTVLYDVPAHPGTTDTPVRDSLATFGVDRGGITWTTPAALPSFSTGDAFSRWVFGTGNFVQDQRDDGTTPNLQTAVRDNQWSAVDMMGNALVGSGDIKPCIEIDCGSTQAADLEAIPFCLCFDNFMTRAYPEWVKHTTDLVMIAQARWTEQMTLAKMFDAPGVVNYDGAAGDAAAIVGQPETTLGVVRDFLVEMRLVTAQYRWRNRMSSADTVRLYVPTWLRDAMASDLTLQAPGDNTLDTSYNEVVGYLGAANINPVWYIDDIPAIATFKITAATDNFDSLLGYPADVNWMLFPTGSFVRLDAGSLDLGVVRTKDDILKNKYCTFSETFEGIAYMGPADTGIGVGHPRDDQGSSPWLVLLLHPSR